MTNIIVLCHERYKLTVQCINSIRKNTKEGSYTLTIVDDYSSDFRVRNYLDDQTIYHPKDTTAIRVYNSRHCLGALKNLGVMHSELTFGRGDWLCVLDNDVCVFEGWLDVLTKSLLDLTGSVRHPFHGVNGKIGNGHCWQLTDAVAGYCHFMTWETWCVNGPYVADASGIGQSEDYALSRKIVDNKGRVGYIDPPVMAHCGITNSKDEPIVGAELIERVPGVLYL